MARQKNKLCPGCNQIFRGRYNSVTCSDRCRKRLQRARLSRPVRPAAAPTAREAVYSRQALSYKRSRPGLEYKNGGTR